MEDAPRWQFAEESRINDLDPHRRAFVERSVGLRRAGATGERGEGKKELSPALLQCLLALNEKIAREYRNAGVALRSDRVPDPAKIKLTAPGVRPTSPVFTSTYDRTKLGEYSIIGLEIIAPAVSISEMDPGFREAIEALLYAHEAFHYTGKAIVRLFDDPAEGMRVRFSRFGATHYDLKGGAPRNSIEEGLAVLEQWNARDVVRQSFPDAIGSMDQLLMRAERAPEFADIPLESVLFINATPGHSIETYPASVVLVKFLQRSVPEFHRLMLQARYDGNFLPVARAITAVFGQGAYKRVMSAREETARSVVKQLEALLPRGER